MKRQRKLADLFQRQTVHSVNRVADDDPDEISETDASVFTGTDERKQAKLDEDHHVPTEDRATSSSPEGAPLNNVESNAKPQRNKHARGFRAEWKDNRPWLIFDGEKGGMFCSFCQKYNKMPFDRGSWTKVACTRIRLESIVGHEHSASHRDSVALEVEYNLQKNVGSVINPLLKEKDVRDMFACLYFLCKQKLAHTTNFEPILDLTAFLGLKIKENMQVAKNATYCSRTAIQEILSSLSSVVENQIIQDIRDSAYFSIEIDETTDVSTVEQIVVHARYISQDGVLQSKFLKVLDALEKPNEADEANGCHEENSVSLNAETITTKVTHFLETNGLDYSKMVGIGTDGAAVMVGRNNGVTKKIQERQHAVQLEKGCGAVCEALGVHCAAHRLNLAASQASASIPAVKKFFDVLRQLYDFYNDSAVRTGGLKEIQMLFKESLDGSGKVLQPCATRWLSRGENVIRLKNIYISVAISLEREAEERHDAKAKGLHTFITEYKFIYLLLLMCDILPIINGLSKIFQDADSDLSVVPACTTSCINKLNKMKDTDDVNIQQLEKFLENCQEQDVTISCKHSERSTLDALKSKYLSVLCDNINSRFQSGSVLKDFACIFDPSKIPADKEALQIYGQSSITTLAKQFGVTVKEDVCFSEWSLFKQFIQDHHSKTSVTTFLKQVCTDVAYRMMFPIITSLARIYRVLPLHTADAERDFSKLKLIKTVPRNRLNEATVDALMRISIEGPALEAYPFSEAVHHWYRQKNRRIRLK